MYELLKTTPAPCFDKNHPAKRVRFSECCPRGLCLQFLLVNAKGKLGLPTPTKGAPTKSRANPGRTLPFWTKRPPHSVQLIVAVGSGELLLRAAFPHPRGMFSPLFCPNEIGGLPPQSRARFLLQNAISLTVLYGVVLPVHQGNFLRV